MRPDLLAQLRDENEQLRETVRQLQEVLVPARSFCARLGLTRQEDILFRHLASREIATQRSILLALYSDRADDPPGWNIVSVMICKMRPKLRPHGISIELVWGVGYRLTGHEKIVAEAG